MSGRSSARSETCAVSRDAGGSALWCGQQLFDNLANELAVSLAFEQRHQPLHDGALLGNAGRAADSESERRGCEGRSRSYVETSTNRNTDNRAGRARAAQSYVSIDCSSSRSKSFCAAAAKARSTRIGVSLRKPDQQPPSRSCGGHRSRQAHHFLP